VDTSTVPTAAAAVLPVPIEWVVQGGAVGLLGIVALMVFTGRLIPRSHYEELARDRDYWRDAAIKAIGHADELLPAAQITTQVAKALSDATAVQRALGGQPPGGDA
jgi:hypothetical protein